MLTRGHEMASGFQARLESMNMGRLVCSDTHILDLDEFLSVAQPRFPRQAACILFQAFPGFSGPFGSPSSLNAQPCR
jgi:hypothetical protein